MNTKATHIIGDAARYLTFPILMGLSVSAYFVADAAGPTFAAISSIGTMVLLSLALHFIEKVLPYRLDWLEKDNQEANDLGHAVFGTLLGAKVGRSLVALIAPILAIELSQRFGSGLWPSHLPILVQAAIVFLIADFGRYWEHRLMHQVPTLWRFHALHHSAEKLTILKTYRNHFIERCLQSVLSFGPLVALGVPPKLILVYSVPNIFLGLFSHSNVDLRLGPLEYVINGPGAHRIHHSLDAKEGNSNFGSAIVIWDIIFRTYTCPVGRPGPALLGIQDDMMPKGFFSQYFSPFIWNQILCRAAKKNSLKVEPVR